MTTLEQLAEVRKSRLRPSASSRSLQRTLREQGHRQSRRAGEGGRHRQGRSDRGPRPASDQRRTHAVPPGFSSESATAASCATSRRTTSISSCSSPGRPRPTSSPHRWGTCTIPQYPGLEDFGDVDVRGDGGSATSAWTGSPRTAWAPGATAGSTILGTDGFIEIRKNVDIGGRTGGNHLFLVDQKETRVRRLHRRRRCRTASGSWTTCSTGRRRRCRRRTVPGDGAGAAGRETRAQADLTRRRRLRALLHPARLCRVAGPVGEHRVMDQVRHRRDRALQRRARHPCRLAQKTPEEAVEHRRALPGPHRCGRRAAAAGNGIRPAPAPSSTRGSPAASGGDRGRRGWLPATRDRRQGREGRARRRE